MILKPHIIKSGEKIGQSVEQIMFRDYKWLCFVQDALNKKNPKTKNLFHQRIEWVLAQGETRKTKILCPYCNAQFVVFFSVLGNKRFGYSMSSLYTCCDNIACKEHLLTQGVEKKPILLPIVFSSIAQFMVRNDQKQVIQVFKNCFELPKYISKKIALDFFNDNEQ